MKRFKLKKSLAALLSGVITLGTFAAMPLTAGAAALGDVNGDGSIDISDATAIQKSIAQIITFTNTQKAAADVNGDGNVSIADATMVQKYAAHIINSFTGSEYTAEDYVYTAKEAEILYSGAQFLIAGERSTKYFLDTTKTVTCRLPQLNLTSTDAKKINQEIHDELDSSFELYEKYAGTDADYLERVDYRCYLNNSVLSLIIERRTQVSPTSRFYVYNIDVSTGKRLDNDDLIQMSSVSSGEASPYTQLYNVIEDIFTNSSASSDKYFESAKSQSLSDENIESSTFYFNNDGKLCAAFLYYWVAGGGIEGDICELNAEISGN